MVRHLWVYFLQAKQHAGDYATAFISGIFGSGLYARIMGINWLNLFNSVAHAAGTIALAIITGAAGILGKHWAEKLLKRKK